MLKQMQLRGWLRLALTAFCTLSFALGGAVFAQSGPSGSLNGAVEDPSGAAVSGAKVTASNEATGFNRTVAADAAGRNASVATRHASGKDQRFSCKRLLRLESRKVVALEPFRWQIGRRKVGKPHQGH